MRPYYAIPSVTDEIDMPQLIADWQWEIIDFDCAHHTVLYRSVKGQSIKDPTILEFKITKEGDEFWVRQIDTDSYFVAQAGPYEDIEQALDVGCNWLKHIGISPSPE